MSADLDKKVFVRDLKDKFNLIQLTGNEESLDRWIVAPDINRPGLELTGYMRLNDLKRVTIIGTKEIEFINTLDHDTQYARFGIITDAYTPCIIISKTQECPEVLRQIATERNFPVFQFQPEVIKNNFPLVIRQGFQCFKQHFALYRTRFPIHYQNQIFHCVCILMRQ